MIVQSFSDQLFYVTAHIAATGSGRSWTGTGFICSVAVEGGQARLLVTNRHVLEGAEEITIRLVRQSDDHAPLPGHTTSITVVVDEASPARPWIGHPNASVDVAILPFGPIETQMAAMGQAPFYRSVGSNLIPTLTDIEALDSLEEVVFLGYPAGLYDLVNFTPVARRGTTATPIQLDYGGAPAFLIDASVYPGSSGSPVFYFNRGMHLDRKTRSMTLGGNRSFLLGILAAVHTISVSGRIVQVPTQLVAELSQPINLGIVFKTQTIIETIDLALGASGLTRTSPAQAAAVA